MKTNKVIWKSFPMIALLIGLTGCSTEAEDLAEDNNQSIEVTATAIQPVLNTRTAYTDNATEGTTAVVWSSGDTFSAFTSSSTQVPTEFTLSSGAGSSSATFSGTFSSTPSSTDNIYALYPSKGTYNTLTTAAVPFNLANQSGDLEDAQENDYMWASSTFGNLNFQFKHLMSVIYYKLTLPESKAISAISFSSPTNDLITSGTIDMTNGTLTATTTGTINIQEDAATQSTTAATYTGYIVVAPQSSVTDLMITAIGEDGSSAYQTTLTLSNKGLVAGYRYSLAATLSAVTLSSTTATITSDTNYADKTFYYTSTSEGNIFKVTQNNLTLTACHLLKYASSGSGGDNSSFYGTYAAICSTGSGTCSFSGSGKASWSGNLGTVNIY